MTYNIILIFAAVIPAIGLMIYVYKADHLEKESPAMLWRLIIAGVLSSLIALVLERVLSFLLRCFFGRRRKVFYAAQKELAIS